MTRKIPEHFQHITSLNLRNKAQSSQLVKAKDNLIGDNDSSSHSLSASCQTLGEHFRFSSHSSTGKILVIDNTSIKAEA